MTTFLFLCEMVLRGMIQLSMFAGLAFMTCEQRGHSKGRGFPTTQTSYVGVQTHVLVL